MPIFRRVIMIPLEDNFDDILGKAQRGLELNKEKLAELAGVSVGEWLAAIEGKVDDAVLRKLSKPLRLGAEALVEIAHRTWKPPPLEVPGLLTVNTPFHDMTVNAYLVWDASSKKAAVFDTGADCDGLLEGAQERGLTIELILLTHTHRDHVFDLDRLVEKTGAKVYVSEREPLEGAESFKAGRAFSVGTLTIETRLTWGHAEGGMTYLVKGLSRPVALVGDALFAGSMGGGLVSYADALRTNREEIFSLPDETVVCPGHGPLTTVEEEKRHNPFFPEFQKN